ncbi:MAG TPA: TolC family protein [Acidobacteriota bacterium]|nr:TolC family protein [Acidobacteriota bacterium]
MKNSILSFLAASCMLTLIFGQVQQGDEDPPAWKTLQEQTVPMPEPYGEKVRAQGAFLELSLNDAIRLALTNNLELEIENFNEELNQQRVIQTRGFYDPVFSFRFGWNSSERPSTSVLDAGRGTPTNIAKSWFLATSLQQNVSGGGSVTLDFDNSRSTNNSAFTTIDPRFGSDFQLAFRQPLWRGFRDTQTERQIQLYNLDTQLSDSQFQQRVAEVVQQVQTQYWELVFAVQSYEARRQSMELAIVQFENNKIRARIGVLAPIEITSSRAEVASREQEMIQSEVQIILAENGLKRLLAPDPGAPLWSLGLIPTDEPRVNDMQVAVALDEAVRLALQRRPELDQVRLNLESNDVDRKFLRRDGRPTVDLFAAVLSAGTAGRVLRDEFVDTDGDGIPDTSVGRVPATDSPFFGSFGNSLGQVFGFDFLTYSVGVDVQIPLRNRSNEAQLAHAGISERQLQSRMKNLQQMIVVEVRNAFQTIQTQRKRLEAAQLARRLSAEQLRGEDRRFQAGLSTNFEVLRFQRDLADAHVVELRARIDLQQAVTALQKAMFTIVDESDIVVARR